MIIIIIIIFTRVIIVVIIATSHYITIKYNIFFFFDVWELLLLLLLFFIFYVSKSKTIIKLRNISRETQEVSLLLSHLESSESKRTIFVWPSLLLHSLTAFETQSLFGIMITTLTIQSEMDNQNIVFLPLMQPLFLADHSRMLAYHNNYNRENRWH